MFVTNDGSNFVSIVGAATDAVTETIPVRSNPNGIAVDPATGLVYLANSRSGMMSVIAESTNTVVAATALGAAPAGTVPTP